MGEDKQLTNNLHNTLAGDMFRETSTKGNWACIGVGKGEEL